DIYNKLKKIVLLKPVIMSISYIDNNKYIFSDRKKSIYQPIDDKLKEIINKEHNSYLLSNDDDKYFSYIFKFGTGFYKVNYYKDLFIKNIHNSLTRFKVYNDHENPRLDLFRTDKIIDHLNIIISSGINKINLLVLTLFNIIISFCIIIKIHHLLSNYFSIDNSMSRLINKGVRNNEFIPYYQNIYSFSTKKFIGAEVLCRWNHKGEILTPNYFIQKLESSDNINIVTFRLIEQAFKDLNCSNNQDYLLSFNFTVAMILDCLFVDKVINFIETTPNVKNHIIIELTESDNRFKQLDDIRKVMLKLKKHGVLLSIDDFGTGYSNLLTIQELPFDVMKIDRAFVSSEYAVSNSNMLDMMVKLGNSMNLLIVVEGVETEDELNRIKDLGVDFCQGFYYSKPSNSEIFKKSLSC
ncbi:EAL domain-containing protein, partial [Photobacterium kishitanii]